MENSEKVYDRQVRNIPKAYIGQVLHDDHACEVLWIGGTPGGDWDCGVKYFEKVFFVQVCDGGYQEEQYVHVQPRTGGYCVCG